MFLFAENTNAKVLFDKNWDYANFDKRKPIISMIMPEFKRFSNKNSVMTVNSLNHCKSRKIRTSKSSRKFKSMKNSKAYFGSNDRNFHINPLSSASSSLSNNF